MQPNNYLLDDVFGLVRGIPLTYVERENIDSVFLKALRGRKHIVVRGGSKQGKTSLRRRHLQENFIAIQCQVDWTIRDIHLAILQEAGFTINEEKDTKDNTRKVSALFGSSFLGLDMKLGSEKGNSNKTETTRKPIEINPENVGDIISALKACGFTGHIVVDDFHYLPIITQSKFSILLKAFHELSNDITFLIIGVWKEENRLLSMNGDLAGRLIDIGVDFWSDNDLFKIITSGEKYLNIKINPDFSEYIVRNCCGSAYIVQEACHELCADNTIDSTQPFERRIGNIDDARRIINNLMSSLDPRYSGFLSNFLNLRDLSITRNIPKKDYLSLLYLMLTCEISDMRQGIQYNTLFDIRNTIFNDKNFAPQLKTMLIELAQAQNAMSIRPIIIGYNSNKQLIEFFDREFLFWLSQNDRAHLLESHRLSETQTNMTTPQDRDRTTRNRNARGRRR